MTILDITPISRRRFARLAAAAPAALLAGCGGLLPTPGQPPQLYVLRAGGRAAADLPAVSRQLLVSLPTATAGLDTERIALSRSPYTLDYFANAAWTDHAPAVVQSVLVETFEATGRIESVSRDVASLRADYILMSELRRFEAVYDGAAAPTVHAVLAARLVRMPDRLIIAEEEAAQQSVAAENRMGPIVIAFGAALDGLAQALAGWTLRRIAADTAPPAGRRRSSPS